MLLQNNLISYRQGLIECLVEAYRDAGTKAELEQMARSTLTDPAVVQEVLARYDKLLLVQAR